MFDSISTIFLPLFISFLIATVLTPFTIKFANKFKLVDDPSKRKHPASIQNRLIPRAGGLPIFIAIFITSIIFIPLTKVFNSILFAGFIVVLIGLLDDRYDLSPYFRFFINILCASIVVVFGASIPFVTNPFGGILHFNYINFSFLSLQANIPIAEIFAIFWIVWVMNMLNWSKGVDGQMPGIAAISAIIIGIASLRFPVLGQSNLDTSKMAFIVAGSGLGFLIFNFYPSKILPGYSATILGFLIGVLSILSSVKLATLILVMGLPMTDAVITIIRRVLSKKSPFWHDKGHLHHHLLNFGLNHREISILYWIMSALLGIISLSLSSKGKLFAIILVVVVVSSIILTLKYITKISSKNMSNFGGNKKENDG